MPRRRTARYYLTNKLLLLLVLGVLALKGLASCRGEQVVFRFRAPPLPAARAHPALPTPLTAQNAASAAGPPRVEVNFAPSNKFAKSQIRMFHNKARSGSPRNYRAALPEVTHSKRPPAEARRPVMERLMTRRQRGDLAVAAFTFAMICAGSGVVSLLLAPFLASGTLALVGLGLLLFGFILAIILVKTMRWQPL